MDPQNFLAPFHVGKIDGDLAIKTARAEQSRIENIGPVSGSDDNDSFLGIESVHLDEQGIEGLFALIVAASDAMASMTTDRVNFVDENNARRGFLALLKHVADTAGADADKHLDEIGTADREEWDISLAGDGAGEQCLAGAGRPDQKHAFGNAPPEFLKLLRITQKLDQLLHFILGFLDSGDVAKSDLIFVAGQHACFGFAKVEGAFAGHTDLLAEQEIENEEKERDREKTKNGLGEQVRFGADGRLNAGSGKSLLQIGTEIQIDNGAKLHRLFGASGLFAVITNESPGGLAFLNEQGNWEVFVANDLLVIEELDKAVVGDVLDILVTTVTNEQGHADEAKGNGNKNDAAPVKVRLVIALIIALGIAVGLRH